MSLSPGLCLKLVKDSEIHKMICPPRHIHVLKEHISTFFSIGDCHIRYIDEQGATIPITSDEELQNAFREANRTQSVSFRLYIEARN